MRSGLAKEPADWLEALGYPHTSFAPRKAIKPIHHIKPKIESIAA